jgi:hypothetical protein
MAGKRRFGSVRQFRSGRWQARYTGPDGVRHLAPGTFATKTDALVWLDVKAAEIARGEWLDPDAGRVPLGGYAAKWIAERPLGRRTEEKYDRLLRLHIEPELGRGRSHRHHPWLGAVLARWVVERGRGSGDGGRRVSAVAGGDEHGA